MDMVKFEDNICYVKSGKKWKARSNFGMTFINHVIATRDSGWIVEVTRASDRVSGLTHFRMADLANAWKLQSALNSGFKDGGLLCYFKGEEMFQLNNKLDEEMRQKEDITKSLLTTAGSQDSLDLYFLNPQQVINLQTGELLDHQMLPLVWIPDWPGSGLPREDLFHQIHLPVAVRPFQIFLDEAKTSLMNNFAPALLAWSAMLMMFRYRWILRHIRHFNLPLLYGPPSVGKTLVAQCAAWLCGCQETQIASRCTLPFLIQWLTTSSMPFIWDDPTNPEEVGQLAVDLGNGAVRGKANEMPQVPTTGCLVTANFDLSAVARYHSRLCIIKMDPLDKPKQPGVARRLESCADKASSALPILLKSLWSMKDKDVHACTDELSRKVSVDLRIVEGLAVPLAAAKQILKKAKRDEYLKDIYKYLEHTLLPYTAECLPTRDSCGSIIIQKILNFPQLLQENVELKEDTVRMKRAFLLDVVKIKEATLASVSRENIGSSSKPVRFRCGLRRATTVNCSAVKEELMHRLRRELENPDREMDQTDQTQEDQTEVGEDVQVDPQEQVRSPSPSVLSTVSSPSPPRPPVRRKRKAAQAEREVTESPGEDKCKRTRRRSLKQGRSLRSRKC